MTYKILVFPIPFIGHSNPAIKIVDELIKRYNAKVIVYSIDNFKNQIESMNAEYRKIDGFTYEETQKALKNNENFIQLINIWINVVIGLIDKSTLYVAREIVNENPDLVLYDSISTYVKLALEILNKNYRNRSNLQASSDENSIVPSSPPPPAVVYWTTFINEKGVYPNDLEKNLPLKNITFFEKLSTIVPVIKLNLALRKLAKRLNTDPITFDSITDKDKTKLNIVLTLPELQPRSHLFKDTKFVGPCVSDDVHINAAQLDNNTALIELLKNYPIINPPENSAYKVLKNVFEKDKMNKKLIYVSLGTVYNENNRLYGIILDAFKNFDNLNFDDDDEKTETRLSDLTVIFSLGQGPYVYFQNQINDEVLELPENIILQSSVPQLEILKRASLFITHSGMNSTNESVHFGVPMVCIPLFGDQITNAYRIAIELGFGIQLDFKTMNSLDITLSVRKILSDKSFYDRSTLFSHLASNYNGPRKSAEIIVYLIEKNKKK